jgi:predicted Rdx family selenoprotein
VGVDPELVKGANGIFDLAVDGKLMFSKHRDGRWPDTAEVVQTLQKLM